MANWIAREFDFSIGRYTEAYYNIAQAGVVAVFVDSHFGLDTNAGTAIAPFRTLTRAINHLNTNGANGSRIFMNGVFSENLPTQTFWYDFIGCGGGANGRTLLVFNQNLVVGVRFQRTLTRIHNIETLNYNNIQHFGGRWDTNLFLVNCYIKNVVINAILEFSVFRCFHSILVNCGFIHDNNTGSPGAFLISSLFINPYFISPSNCIVARGINSFISHNTVFTNEATFSIVNQNAQFLNESIGDFRVRITSPLLGAGSTDEITGIRANVGGVQVGLPYSGQNAEFTTAGGAVITNLTVDANGRYTLTPPNRTGTLVSGAMDLGALYPIENIDLFNVFDFLSGQITQGVFETFVSPKMSLTIRIRYGNTVAELDACPWLLIEYGKLPTFSGTGASRVGNAAPTFTPANFQTITCRFLRISLTIQNNS